MATIGLNGAGRIGRQTLLRNSRAEKLDIAFINDPFMSPDQIAHLTKFDSGQGTAPERIESGSDWISINDRRIAVLNEKNPADLNWRRRDVRLVLECSGAFTSRMAAQQHLDAGAEKVLISAPSDDADMTAVFGVNHLLYDPATHSVVSGGSCTTNCLAPVAYVIKEELGFVRGWMTTTHAYTADQRLQDAPHKDLRRARAASVSIIPTKTGAAEAIGLIIPDLTGKIDGSSFRVPVITGSVVDLVVDVGRPVTAQEANGHFRTYSQAALAGILGVSDLPLVSCDYIGTNFASTVDTELTRVVGDQLLRVVSWYDNELSFVSQYLRLANFMHSHLK